MNTPHSALRIPHSAPHSALRIPHSALLLALFLAPSGAWACPFCRAVNETISDKLEIADAVAVVKPLAESAKSPAPGPRMQGYELLEVLKDNEGTLRDARHIEAPPPQNDERGKFVVFGALGEGKKLYWLTPRPVTDRAVNYLKKLPSAPPKESGPDRLAFFQEFLNDSDPFLADDAYDEIARASYADVKALGPRMQREKLLAWVQDDKVSALRRRQFLSMLAVCGRKEDAAVLEKLVLKERGGPEGALDATLACYLALSGAEGLPLVEKRIVANPKASLSDGLALAAALRFHGEEEKIIPRPRLLETLRLYLDRPAWADQVMAELARWEDWSVLDRMVKLFQEADRTTVSAQAAFALRVPILRYLQACPLPEAARHLAALEKSHPDVARAAGLYPFLPAPPKKSTVGASYDEGEPELLPPPKTENPSPSPRDAKPRPTAKQKPGAKTARATTPKDSAETQIKGYSVIIVGLTVLFATVAILGLLMVILFGFRPRAR